MRIMSPGMMALAALGDATVARFSLQNCEQGRSQQSYPTHTDIALDMPSIQNSTATEFTCLITFNPADLVS
jgi:hypothetical protein